MDLKWNPNLFRLNYTPQAESCLASVLAGTWYPAEPAKLRKTVLDFLAQADAETCGSSAGDDCNVFIIPHAGYAYSGLCAAYAYRHLRPQKQIRRVLLLAPSHRAYLQQDQIVVPESDAVSTPLGKIQIDRMLRKKLLAFSCCTASDQIHRHEHSTQIQYPFLQSVLQPDSFTILPVITGHFSDAGAERLGMVLKEILSNPGTVLIISSDFTHYGADFGYTPFSTDRVRNVRKSDLGAYHYIQTNDAAGFRKYVSENRCTICGAEPVFAMLSMKAESFAATLFHYCTSADDGGDDRRFVCYLSCGIKVEMPESCVLSDSDKITLLSMARRSIAEKFHTGKSPAPDRFVSETTPAMRSVMGAFVTLHSPDGNLRGCIGEIQPMRPLYEAVTGRACDAAFRDPRFFPLRSTEFNGIEIEISALTPSRPVQHWREIEIGRHGMTVTKHGRSAVFLPQVAPEQGWNLEETLSHLCVKAGLKPDDFRSGASFTVFEAIVFSEKEYHHGK